VSDWELLDEPEVRAGVACLFLGPLVAVCHRIGVGPLTIEGVVLMVTGLIAPVLTRPGALLLAATGWSVVTGFITHELGELAFARSDLALMAALAATSLLAPRRTPRLPRGHTVVVVGRSDIGRGRRVRAYVLSASGLPLLTAALIPARATLALATMMLAFLLLVIVVALVGGRGPAVASAVGSSLLLNFFFTPPYHTWVISDPDNAVSLLAFVLVAVLVSWAVDVAARRTQQAAEAAARVETLDSVARLRSALLAAVGHDLRTPLAVAKAGVSGARSGDPRLTGLDRAELLGSADHALDRLTSLIDNLLDLSRLQTGAAEVRLRPVAVDEVLAEALGDVGVEPRRLYVDLPDDLPEVLADAGLLERVFANLIANAQRHAPVSRPPEVHAAVAGDRVEVRFVDHGPGIAEEEWERVFQPFQRLGDAPAGSGVGLGLALVRGLTEAMQGDVRPEHTPGGGATMVVSLPAGPS
jgi:two-component system sensor histidine kinase KdpD